MKELTIAATRLELDHFTRPPLILAGPCVLEDEDLILKTARELQDITAHRGLPFAFKASFDKANRSSVESPRGPGLERGLELLSRVKSELGCWLVTDIHEPHQAAPVGEVVDLIQIPAFLCRQTDLLVAAARTGKPVNIKKGQFLAPEDMVHPIAKVRSQNEQAPVLLTDRGTFFGYGRLVVDFAGMRTLHGLEAPLLFDATHSVQQPGGLGHRTGGDRTLVPYLARAAAAVGVDGFFFEVHPDPERAPSDGPNMVYLEAFGDLLDQILAVRTALSVP